MNRAHLRRRILACERCSLHAQCEGPVPFRGPVPAPWAIVGEAPGGVEDVQGLPFVGPSGELVKAMLSKMGLDMKDGFICNVVSCYPHGTPKPEHIEACRDNLRDQLVLAQAPYVLLLGSVAFRVFWPEESIMRLHGVTRAVSEGDASITLFATFHPAAVLRNRALSRAWRLDLEEFARMVKEGNGA